MAQFKYTLPSGKKFTMTAPAGTTQLQADRIFYGQVAAGALVGFAAGQTASGTPTQAVKFALSRLDRGTAGVDDRVILSIIDSIPTIAGLPPLINVPLENPINQADLANIKFDNTYTPPAIGPISSNQVQGLLAQVANFVNQPSNVMTDDKGVGLYGLNCQQLEASGYVKPGTYRRFIFDPSPMTQVLSAPGIFTGRNGVSSVTDFLNNTSSQSDAMTTLMTQSYNSLTASGSIIAPITQTVSALAGQVYTQSGLQTISQLSAATGISLSPSSLTGLNIANTPIAGFLSNPVSSVGTLASGALNNLNSFTNLSSISTSINNAFTGGVSSLVTNASKFGTTAVNQWIGSSGVGSLLNNAGLGSVSNTLTSSLNSTIGGLTTDLTKNIQNLDVLGKASQFASGFSNPLTSLSNLGDFNLNSLTSGLPDTALISQLGSDLLGQAGDLAGSLASGVQDLVGSLTDSLGGLVGNLGDSLGSLGDFASLGDLGGLGGLGDIGGLFGGGGDSLVSSTQIAAGYSNTVNRAAVDTAFAKILGDPKIPKPSFEIATRNSSSAGASADISYAQTQLSGDQQSIQNLYSQPLGNDGGFTPPEEAVAAVASANGLA